MNRLELQKKILTVAARLVLLPPLLMLAIIPGAIQNPDPGANYTAIIIVMSVLGILHLVIRIGYLRNIRAIRQGRPADSGLNVGMGILLLLCCLFILDGAVESYDQNLYVSILMFTAAGVDLVTGLASVGTIFLKPKTRDQLNS
jgi:hypothetical protein